ncbi:signal transducer and transcription activator Stat92E isoform X2 [Lycorma delicatula]|uniref:signal transducer and transcription activator Stat92E isoform X2 n=1 Tax=Lycorma delicatula TaxID=130591 RepID=UPI003F519216
MSLWMRTQQLKGNAFQQIRAVYGDQFPIEVRHFLASWLEERMWVEIEPQNPQHEQLVNNLVEDLAQELEAKVQTMTSEAVLVAKWNLLEAARMFRSRYSQCPQILFEIIRNCLNAELRLVQQAENDGNNWLDQGMNMMTDTTADILQEIDLLQSQTHKTNCMLQHLEQEQEAFALKFHECSKIAVAKQQLEAQSPQNIDLQNQMKEQHENLQQHLKQKATSIVNQRCRLLDLLKETVTRLCTLQSRILDDELLRWKREQQLAGNGAKFNSNLDTIQDWCESLAEIIWQNRQQIKKTELLIQNVRLNTPVNMMDPHDVPKSLNAQITQLLSSLITSTFIIEKQPPQVMKTNTKFVSTVRLLVGGKLNVHMNPPQVKVTIISEAQANALLKNDKIATKGDASGEILNNTGTMEYQQATRHLSVNFRNMQLKKIRRAEKKGTESVMDEKFSLLFSSQFSVGGGELHFQVWTLSLPVVVIVHGNQEPHAWATVTWDNAFAEPGRAPFSVPEKVTWAQVTEALNMKFTAATGRSLTEDNLRFLAEKAFRTTCLGNDYNSLMLSWTQFCKEPLPERSFTFWEWFYAVMKLTREHLKNFWVDGLIHGFIRRKQAEEMLSTRASGTFLLRFADSELGGVTVAWVKANAVVCMLLPFTSKDFSIRSLADRLSDLPDLVTLYPDICKMQAISKYCTNETQITSSNGYVKPLLVVHIPTMAEDIPSQSNPFQPQSPVNGSDDPYDMLEILADMDDMEMVCPDILRSCTTSKP